jgi:hypothetical protein
MQSASETAAKMDKERRICAVLIRGREVRRGDLGVVRQTRDKYVKYIENF